MIYSRLLLVLDSLILQTLERHNIDKADECIKLLLCVLVVVSLSRYSDSDTVRNSLDAVRPHSLVELGVETHVGGLHCCLCELSNALHCLWCSLLELAAVNYKHAKLRAVDKLMQVDGVLTSHNFAEG